MDGLQIESLWPFIVVSSYAGAMVGLVIALIYHIHEESFFRVLQATGPRRPFILFPFVTAAVFAKIASDLGSKKMINDVMSMQLKCWTSLQFWELVDSWTPEEYFQVLKHYDCDEWLFPLLYSCFLMGWAVYETAFANKLGKKLASLAVVLSFVSGVSDVIENEMHFSFLRSSDPGSEDRAETREWVTDTLVSATTTVSVTKWVSLSLVLAILISSRCGSGPNVETKKQKSSAKITKKEGKSSAKITKKEGKSSAKITKKEGKSSTKITKQETSEDVKKNQ